MIPARWVDAWTSKTSLDAGHFHLSLNLHHIYQDWGVVIMGLIIIMNALVYHCDRVKYLHTRDVNNQQCFRWTAIIHSQPTHNKLEIISGRGYLSIHFGESRWEIILIFIPKYFFYSKIPWFLLFKFIGIEFFSCLEIESRSGNLKLFIWR